MRRDEEHKLVKSKGVNDEEVVRVPLAFAMVKVMQSLPQEVMEANLPRYGDSRSSNDIYYATTLRIRFLYLAKAMLGKKGLKTPCNFFYKHTFSQCLWI